MKVRSLITAAVAATLLLPSGARADEATQAKSYLLGFESPLVAPACGNEMSGGSVVCFDLDVSGLSSITVEVTDATTLPVGAYIQVLGPGGEFWSGGHTCGGAVMPVPDFAHVTKVEVHLGGMSQVPCGALALPFGSLTAGITGTASISYSTDGR